MDSPSVAFATSIVGISEANDKLIACLSGALSFAFAPLALSLFPRKQLVIDLPLKQMQQQVQLFSSLFVPPKCVVRNVIMS